MTKQLTGRELRQVRKYLAGATSHQLSSIGWDSQRRNCHGEGRSQSKGTWHIRIWKQSTDGHHFSAIVCGGSNGPEVEDTRIDYGPTQPSMTHVLNEHKRQYSVTVNTPSPHDSDPENGGELGGSGGSGHHGKGKGKGKHWSKKVKRDNYGGYYYIGPEGEYNTCDEAGNDIDYGDSSASTYSYAANPAYPSYYSSNSEYLVDSGYTTTSAQHAASSSTEYYIDSAGRRYYIDEYGNTQWA
ncbi:hypothetical protein ANO14919_098570 [Xylariales sp. No.14919]|nr:hypothetical protein ANO14919_098570 [Xylariales sp. No.14919]